MSECTLSSSPSIQPAETKYCRVCGCELVIGENWTESHKRKSIFTCKKCMHEYRLNNKERIVKYQHEYRLNNKEKLVEYKREYRLNNKEKLSERNKEYYLKNKEKLSERNKEYYLNNKEKINEQYKEYRLNLRTRKIELYLNYREYRKLLRQFEGFFPLYTIRMVDI